MKIVSQFDAISGNGVPFGASFRHKGRFRLERPPRLRWHIEWRPERERGNGRIVYACRMLEQRLRLEVERPFVAPSRT